MLCVAVLPDGGMRESGIARSASSSGRDSPFSIWGQEAWLAQDPSKVARRGAGRAVASSRATRHRCQVAALGAAVLIALQLTLAHWFYLYIVWCFPLVLVALLARGTGDWHARHRLP